MRIDILKPLRKALRNLLKGRRRSAEKRRNAAARIVEALNDMIGECLARLMQMRVDVAQALIEGVRERAVSARQRFVNRRAGLLKPAYDLFAVRGQRAEQFFADAGDGEADL